MLSVLMDGEVCAQRGRGFGGGGVGLGRDRILAYSEEIFVYSSVKLSCFSKFWGKSRTTPCAYFAYSRKYAHTLHTSIIKVK